MANYELYWRHLAPDENGNYETSAVYETIDEITKVYDLFREQVRDDPNWIVHDLEEVLKSLKKDDDLIIALNYESMQTEIYSKNESFMKIFGDLINAAIPQLQPLMFAIRKC